MLQGEIERQQITEASVSPVPRDCKFTTFRTWTSVTDLLYGIGKKLGSEKVANRQSHIVKTEKY